MPGRVSPTHGSDRPESPRPRRPASSSDDGIGSAGRGPTMSFEPSRVSAGSERERTPVRRPSGSGRRSTPRAAAPCRVEICTSRRSPQMGSVPCRPPPPGPAGRRAAGKAGWQGRGSTPSKSLRGRTPAARLNRSWMFVPAAAPPRGADPPVDALDLEKTHSPGCESPGQRSTLPPRLVLHWSRDMVAGAESSRALKLSASPGGRKVSTGC
jgi:hypothetical protein